MDRGGWFLAAGSWSLVTRYWSLAAGLLSLVKAKTGDWLDLMIS
jgi:hypothetical protein